MKREKKLHPYRWAKDIDFEKSVALKKLLVEKEFIAPDTKTADFKRIFYKEARNKINWIGDAPLLHLLLCFHLLWTKKLVNEPPQKFKEFPNYFLLNGAPIEKEDLQTLRTSYHKIKKGSKFRIKRKEKIIEIIESLQKH